jgi:hypothetical protein
MKIFLFILVSTIYQNSISKTLKCIGSDIKFNGQKQSNDVSPYWEDFKINEKILSIPKYGDFKLRSEGDIYWLNNNNWVKLIPETGNFTVSIQSSSGSVKSQIQGQCTEKRNKLY